MAVNLRRLLVAAALLPLAFRAQEVKASADELEESTTEETTTETEAATEAPEPVNGTAGNDTSANVTSTTQEPPDCPEECYDSKFEVMAKCDNKLLAFDNLCYYYQHKCIHYESDCRFYCCLYPGTDLASASKFDCNDWCKF